MTIRSEDQGSLFVQSQDSIFNQPLLRELRSTGVDSCLPWLTRSGLTFNVDDYYEIEATKGEVQPDLTEGALLGVPVHKCEAKTSRELQTIKSMYKGQTPPGIDPNSPESIERLWQDLQSGRSRVIDFQFSPVGWNAIACYWPFHLDAGRWGIYISVPRIIRYANRLLDTCGHQLAFLGSVESMLRCMLFTIFHHEFFHHIAESTATSLEIASAAFGTPRPLYRDYRCRVYEERLGLHPHRPLEEALANAYAHNSLGFVSKMQLGYVAGEAKAFQKVFQASWPAQGAGYASAGHYAGQNRGPDGYLGGCTRGTSQAAHRTRTRTGWLARPAQPDTEGPPRLSPYMAAWKRNPSLSDGRRQTERSFGSDVAG